MTVPPARFLLTLTQNRRGRQWTGLSLKEKARNRDHASLILHQTAPTIRTDTQTPGQPHNFEVVKKTCFFLPELSAALSELTLSIKNDCAIWNSNKLDNKNTRNERFRNRPDRNSKDELHQKKVRHICPVNEMTRSGRECLTSASPFFRLRFAFCIVDLSPVPSSGISWDFSEQLREI